RSAARSAASRVTWSWTDLTRRFTAFSFVRRGWRSTGRRSRSSVLSTATRSPWRQGASWRSPSTPSWPATHACTGGCSTSCDTGPMRIAVAADEPSALAQFLLEELRVRGHEPLLHGALAPDERPDWAWGSAAAAHDVV